MSRPVKLGPDMSRRLKSKNEPITLFGKPDRRHRLKIIAVTSDLFLRSRIAELAKQTGADALFAENPDVLRKLAASNRPQLVVLDLSATEYDPFSVARELKVSYNPKLFGLYPHVKTDLKIKADKLGFEYVVPNSSFLLSLRQVMLEGAEDD